MKRKIKVIKEDIGEDVPSNIDSIPPETNEIPTDEIIEEPEFATAEDLATHLKEYPTKYPDIFEDALIQCCKDDPEFITVVESVIEKCKDEVIEDETIEDETIEDEITPDDIPPL